MATPPTNEWILSDADSLRRALDGMRRQRKLSWEDLFHRAKGRNFYAFFHGVTANLRSDSLLRLAENLDYEVVIRPISTPKMQRRLALLASEKQAREAEQAAREQVQEFEAEGRDETGKLKVLTQRQHDEAEALLEEYGKF